MSTTYKNSKTKKEYSKTKKEYSKTKKEYSKTKNEFSKTKNDFSTTFMNKSSVNSLDFNYNDIESKLKDRKCKTKEDCFDIGECDTKSGMCKFKDIYCTRESCFQDNGCNMSYVKNARPQYLKTCERNTVRIFETCHPEINNSTCVTRECVAHEQCLSHKCYYNRCVTNEKNPIYYCSNIDSGNELSCKLILNEPCTKNEDCFSNHCGAISKENKDISICLEPSSQSCNIVAFFLTNLVVIVSLLSLYYCYKRVKKSKHY